MIEADELNGVFFIPIVQAMSLVILSSCSSVFFISSFNEPHPQKETESFGSGLIGRLASLSTIQYLLPTEKSVFNKKNKWFIFNIHCFLAEFCCTSCVGTTRVSKKFKFL